MRTNWKRMSFATGLACRSIERHGFSAVFACHSIERHAQTAEKQTCKISWNCTSCKNSWKYVSFYRTICTNSCKCMSFDRKLLASPHDSGGNLLWTDSLQSFWSARWLELGQLLYIMLYNLVEPCNGEPTWNDREGNLLSTEVLESF